MTTLAVDMSNWTDPLTPVGVSALKDAGVGHVIVQAVDPPAPFPPTQTRDQVQACVAAGFSVDAYVWLWFDLDPGDISRKLALLDGLPIRKLWLDVEDTAAVKYTQTATEGSVGVALALCDERLPDTGIYTGRWFWTDPRYMANTTAFADRELWDANYDDVADAALGFVPYGGWTVDQVRIKQFRGTTTLGGLGGLDLNVLSVLEAGEIQPAPTGLDQAWLAKKSLVVGLAGELLAVADQIDAAVSSPLPMTAMHARAEDVRSRARRILA
jgi:hypothetical protein